MQPQYRVTETWLTKKPRESAFCLTAFLTLFLFSTSLAFFYNFKNLEDLMPASDSEVFTQHQYWRAWSSLFAHADWGHLMSNSLLFIPLSYLLMSYFSPLLFPILGLLVGGLTNLLVLQTMPPDSSLIGISGVVYWMGATWLTLFILIDTRKTLRRRFALALFISLLLFVPEKYEPNVSYMSHFLGYVSGIICGGAYYLWNRKKIIAAEVKEPLMDEDDFFISELSGARHLEPGTSTVRWSPSDL
jgi:rhomboid protease GluP